MGGIGGLGGVMDRARVACARNIMFVFASCAALQYRTSALAAATVVLAVAALAAAATAPVLLPSVVSSFCFCCSSFLFLLL